MTRQEAWNLSPMDTCKHCAADVFPDQTFEGMPLCDFCIESLENKRQQLLDAVNRIR